MTWEMTQALDVNACAPASVDSSENGRMAG